MPMMIFPGGRAVVSLRAQCLASRRTIVTSSVTERNPRFKIPFHYNNKVKTTLSLRYLSPLRFRSYADKPVSRPKAHTGRVSTTQRRAPTTSATKAAKTPGPRRTAPKAIAKEKSSAKPKLKSKPKPKKKTASKPKPKPKKPLTDKQQARKAAKQEKDKVKDLKEKALFNAPKLAPASAWQVFLTETVKARASGTNGEKLGDIARSLSSEFKNMTPEQLEHYNHLSNQNITANKAAYAQWVKSYTPDEIRIANNSRRALMKLDSKQRGMRSRKIPQIHDDRQVHRPRTSYLAFFQDRYATGDFKGLKVPEAAKLAGREWKALSATEQQKYKVSPQTAS